MRAMQALLSGSADPTTDAGHSGGADGATDDQSASGLGGQEHAGGAELEVEEEDPALVDSRSVYVGNVSTHPRSFLELRLTTTFSIPP